MQFKRCSRGLMAFTDGFTADLCRSCMTLRQGICCPQTAGAHSATAMHGGGGGQASRRVLCWMWEQAGKHSPHHCRNGIVTVPQSRFPRLCHSNFNHAAPRSKPSHTTNQSMRAVLISRQDRSLDNSPRKLHQTPKVVDLQLVFHLERLLTAAESNCTDAVMPPSAACQCGHDDRAAVSLPVHCSQSQTNCCAH